MKDDLMEDMKDIREIKRTSMYVIIIGGQAYPMQLFPGKTILESSF